MSFLLFEFSSVSDEKPSKCSKDNKNIQEIRQKGGFTMIANEEASPVHVPLSLEACTRRVYFPGGNFV